MSPDDHTDYFWSATDVEYEQLFLSMLDYYIQQVKATAGELPEYQSRFSTDGSLWLKVYEDNRTPGEFQRLVDTMKSGHISAPLNPLVITYGGVPAEAVIRSMYYAGQLERRYGVDFPLAIAMENAGMSFGLGALWAGAGAAYSWKGVCNCPSLIPNLNNRAHEIYRWVGPDGSSLIMKWNSLHTSDSTGNTSIGGYAEARYPDAALDYVTSNAAANGFTARYPYNTIGVFGQGWDDLLTTNLDIQQTCKAKSNSTRACIVSDTVDFFEEFEALYGAGLPTVAAGFGNEWDLSPASLAEESARLKRSLEKLRAAEALATLVSLKDPAFLRGREVTRDKAFLNFGLYFEHDFENGGPGVSGTVRIAWQRQVADEIESYVDGLMAEATNALGAMIQKNGTQQRFFVFNSLSWARTDIADIPYTGSLPVHVVDLATGAEVPSQVVTVNGVQLLRIEAPDIPSVGYKVFEIQPGSGQVFTNGPTANVATGVMENARYRITVSPRGAITSFIDKQLNDRQFVGTTGGFALNDLGSGSGSLQIENAGPVSVTFRATSTSPLAHVTRVTLMRSAERVEIYNEVTQNFGGTREWRFSFNLTSPDVWHEEVGAIARARLTTNGGSYSPRNARYDYLTLNHFADMSGSGAVGMTLSNADAYFMTVGASTISTLDTTTPQLSVVLGGSLRPFNPILNQAGDSHFTQRFALQSHGAFAQPSAMRFALAHQNPLMVGGVTGGSEYPEVSYSYLSISNPDVLLWALKPAEEGIGEGVTARVWNLSAAATNFALSLDEPIVQAKHSWHIETDRGDAPLAAGALVASMAPNQMLSFRLFPASLSPAVKILPTNMRAVETGQTGVLTVVRTGSRTLPVDVPYTVSGSATPGSDYVALPGVVTIPAGASSAVIAVVPILDAAAESEETVNVTLTPQPQYLLGQWDRATVSIVNDVAAPPPTAVLYPFSEGTGSTTADASGNNNTGTLQNGPTWVAGKYGNGLGFDGSNDYVSVTDSAMLDLTAAGTIEAWVKLDTLNRWHGVISKGILNSDPAHNYALEITNANRFLCILGNGTNAAQLTSTLAVTAGQFYHAACVWNGTALQLYVNGVLNASIVQNVTPASNALPLYIGQFGNSADRFNGIIDEVRIYNHARTSSDIQTDMNTPIGATPSPPDTTSPAVSLSAPAPGAVLAGVMAVSANATDNVGVVGVQFTLNGVNLGNEDTSAPYAMSWDTTTAANGLYTLSAMARDAAGNVNTATDVAVTVNNFIDATPPSVPTGLSATAISSTIINLSWNASNDNVGVAGYQIHQNGSFLATTTVTNYSHTGLTPGATYTYTVTAFDAANNLSLPSAPISMTTPQPPPNTGLVAAYDFRENAGTIAADASGQNNHGTLTNGPTWTALGKYGSAVNFDGANDYIVVPDSTSLDLRNSGTISAWAKFDTLNRWHSILAKGNVNSNAAHNYALELSNGNQFLCILGNGVSTAILRSTIIPVINQFYHVACVWNGTVVQLYINGVLNNSTAQTFTPAGNSASLYIGQFGGNTDRLDGVIDEVKIYNRALTPDEIQIDMNTSS